MESLPEQRDFQYDPSILPTLEQVHAHFQQWRNTRECKGKIPPALWDQIFLLVGRYRETDICTKLGISKPRLQAAILSKSSRDTQTSVDFIPLTLSQTTSHLEPKTKDYIAEILHANGTRLRIASLSEYQFSTLLHVFMKGP
jgi:hypothetical protein